MRARSVRRRCAVPGYDEEDARILTDHVLDAALCGYEYSGLPKLLNVVDYPAVPAAAATCQRGAGDGRRPHCSMAATTPA